MTDLSTLIERVRKATGPDRELDYGIHNATNPPLPSGYVHGMVPRYTGTADASLALAERLEGHGWFAILVDATRELGVSGTQPPSALPRYIVLATLLAIQSKGAS